MATKYSCRFIKQMAKDTGFASWEIKKNLHTLEAAFMLRPISFSDNGSGVETVLLPSSMADVERWQKQTRTEWLAEAAEYETKPGRFYGMTCNRSPRETVNMIMACEDLRKVTGCNIEESVKILCSAVKDRESLKNTNLH